MWQILKGAFLGDDGQSSRAGGGHREPAWRGGQDGCRRLFPGTVVNDLGVGAYVRDVELPVDVFNRIVGQYQPLLAVAPDGVEQRAAHESGGGVLIGDLEELRKHDRLRIVDAIAARGQRSQPWCVQPDAALRAELDWYGRNVRGVFFAGEWQLTPFESLDRPSPQTSDAFANLVAGEQPWSVPAAVLLHISLHQLTPKVPDPTEIIEGRWQLHQRAFLWQRGRSSWRDVDLCFERHRGNRAEQPERPWHIRDRDRFDRELKTLSTFAADARASFLDDMRAVFSVQDPAWSEQLILVTPDGYPRQQPLVFLQSGGPADEPRQIELSEIGIQWTEDSLLARVLYALERRSEPDGGNLESVRK